MSGHEQFGEDLALHALNALEGENRVALEKHLATCADCRLELEQLRGDGALLALSTMGPKPPRRSRERLLAAVATEAASAAASASSRSIPDKLRFAVVGMAGLGSDRRSSGVRRFPLERELCFEAECCIVGLSNGPDHARVGRSAAYRCSDHFSGSAESDAGVSQDSAAAAGKGVLFAEQELLAVRCK